VDVHAFESSVQLGTPWSNSAFKPTKNVDFHANGLHENIYSEAAEVKGTLNTRRGAEKCMSTLGLAGELSRFSDQATSGRTEDSGLDVSEGQRLRFFVSYHP
jgi:hypothetical protein